MKKNLVQIAIIIVVAFSVVYTSAPPITLADYLRMVMLMIAISASIIYWEALTKAFVMVLYLAICAIGLILRAKPSETISFSEGSRNITTTPLL